MIADTTRVILAAFWPTVALVVIGVVIWAWKHS